MDHTIRSPLAPDRALPDGTTMRLGAALVAGGHITADHLHHALERQEQSGERLGRILLSMGALPRRRLHAALAEQWSIPLVDLYVAPPPPELVRAHDPGQLLREGWVPLVVEEGAALVATCEPPDARRERHLAEQLGVGRVRFAATTDWDIQEVVRSSFADHLAHRAAHLLPERDRSMSALSGFADWQKCAALLGLFGLAAALALDWRTALTWLAGGASLAYLAAVLFKVVAVVVGWVGLRRRRPPPQTIPDHELPVYTVLVPVYREANVVAGLVEHLARLNYPPEKLEILLLMEEDDPETLAAARAARPPETIRFVVIPDGHPKTKPRACNVGLFFARGEHLVIYDAEDRPDPNQLRDAVAAFREGDESVVCVQARLNYFNARQNVLTRMFTLEYSYWFDYMLPALDAMGLPIPLGGTSNHFRVDALRRLGGWDAFNVTEDADLGIRATALGMRVAVIPSTTYEEACSRTWPWIRQRTRWIKGYMQTAVVHTRRPGRLLTSLDPRALLGVALLIFGTPLIFLVNPVLWTLFGIWIATLVAGIDPLEGIFTGIWWWLAVISLVGGNLLMVAANALAVGRRRLWSLLPFSLLNPLYWMLHSVAAWRALHQLITRPFHWEKTPHGLEGATDLRVPEPADPVVAAPTD